MNTTEFINHISSLNIQLSADGDKLRLNAPKGVLTPELRAELTTRKAEILAFLQEVNFQEPANGLSLEPVSRNQRLPLSFSQQRLWFLYQMDPANVAYNIVGAVRLRGNLNRVALEQTLGEIVRRHESLRTIFGAEDGDPFQQICPPESFALAVEDLSADSDRSLQIDQSIKSEAQCPFDLEHGPLFRARLLELGAEEFVLVVAMHHIVSDGWSVGVFVREFQTLYAAYSTGHPSPLAELSIQYADYAQWQRKSLQGAALERQLTYWKQNLGGKLPVLELPADHPRPIEQSFRGAFQTQVFPPDLTNALLELGRRENVTLFMTLLAAYQTLLYRYTGQTDILVGTPVANRKRVELEGLIGFFVNTLVLRTDLSGEPTFRELLGRVREAALGAFTHQDVPFELLVEVLHPERDASHTPLFQTMLILQNAPMPASDLAGLTSEPMVLDTESAKFDLTLGLVESKKGLYVVFEYNTDLFERPTIQRWMQHFRTILENIVIDPEQKLSELPLLTDQERRQTLVHWNATHIDYPKELCVHELFEASAKRNPDAVAVVFGQTQLTYRELDMRANQLAHYLRRFDIGRESPVGISLERSHEMVVAMLGILKTGGAYVPLDPSFPKERIAYMVQDARVRVVITEQTFAAEFIAAGCQTVCVDSDREAIARGSDCKPATDCTSENLAYVLYTSGSTGRPKGVQIPHRAVVNFLLSMQREPGLTAQDRLLAVTTLSFDIAGLEIFLPLITGAQLIIAPRSATLDGHDLRELLRRSQATVMQATPTTWQLLLLSGWSKTEKLNRILCGGEALPRKLADLLLERCDSLWNMYGPTETTIWSTCQQITPEQELVSIGRPIANTQVYILDAKQSPVPIGVNGELYIGGDGLARGYLNRPDLTADKFVENPFYGNGSSASAKLYRTGDLARFLADGQIFFLGRIDHQVKLRGFRIELEEIEIELRKLEGIHDAVVVARQDPPGDQQLVAYLIANSEHGSVGEIRRLMQSRLPGYMIPSAFVFMDAFPLTPNRKVDRKALPAPANERPELYMEYVAPRTAMERTTAEIWQQVLDRPKIGIHDNFFDLGGHSLLIVRVQSKLGKVTGREIPIAQLFRLPTIAALAQYLEGAQPHTPAVLAIEDRISRRQAAMDQKAQMRKEHRQLS